MRLLFFFSLLLLLFHSAYAPSWVLPSSYFGYTQPQRNCLDPFDKDGIYVLVGLETRNCLSYCLGCIRKKGKLYRAAEKGVVNKSKPELEEWFDRWLVKKTGVNQLEFSMAKVGGLTAESDGAALIVSPQKPFTTWTYERVPNSQGWCVINLKDPQGRYIRIGTTTEESSEFTSVLPGTFPQVVTKIPPNSDAYNFIVYKVQ